MMAKPGLLLLLICAVFTVESLQVKCNGSTKTNAVTALSCCGSKSASLLFPRTLQKSQQLWGEMKKQAYSTTWIDLTRQRLSSWEWISGNVSAQIPLDVHGCGYYNIQNETFDAASCGSRENGHICQYTGCQSCQALQSRRFTCLKIGNDCFTFMCDHKDWYSASLECRSWYARLAVLHDEETRIAFKDSYPCKSFWIGLRREKWLSSDGHSLADTSISLWTQNEPSEKGDCALFEVTKNTFMWKTALCNSESTYLCTEGKDIAVRTYVPYGPITEDFLTTRNNLSIEENQKNTTFILSVALPILGIVFGLVGVFIFLFIKKTLRARKEQKAVQEEMDDLMAGQEEDNDIMEKALRIINYDETSKQFSLEWTNLRRILLRPDTNDKNAPLVVVSIGGPFRLGKSFLMNYLIRYLKSLEEGEQERWLEDRDTELTGFLWRHGARVATFGIWLWSRPFKITLPNMKKVSILLMDTQGAFDNIHDSEAGTMVMISSLLSTIQIYNVTERLQAADFNHFQLFREAGRLMSKSSDQFPFLILKRLIFLVRDRVASQELNRGAKDGNKYLKKLFQELNLEKGIQNSVQQVECFLMPEPGEKASVKQEDEYEYKGELHGLDQRFIDSLGEFARFLFQAEVHFDTGMDGQTLYRKIMWCVSQINSRVVAKPETTLKALIDHTNKETICNALQYFNSYLSKLMDETPSKPLEVISDETKELAKKVERMFSEKMVGDENTRKEVKKKLQLQLHKSIPLSGKKRDKRKAQIIKQACDSYKSKMDKHFKKITTKEELLKCHNTEREKTIEFLHQKNCSSDVDRLDSIILPEYELLASFL